MDEIDALSAACQAMQRAADNLAARRTSRNEAIVAAFASGVSIGAIGELCGLGRSQVQSILGHPRGRVGRPSVADS